MARLESRARTTLALSFGGLILLLALTGIGSMVAIERTARAESALLEEWLNSRRALERVRSGIFLAGILARDYFVAAHAPESQPLLAQMNTLRAETIDALEQSLVSRNARGEVTSLRGEVEAYWKVLELMASMAGGGRGSGADSFFRGQLAQRRDAMMQLMNAVGAAAEREASARAAELEARRRRFRVAAIAALAAAVALGAILAAWTIARLLALEAESAGFATRLVKAQEDERRAIARELHDGIGQSLTAMLMDAGQAEAEAPDARRRLESIRLAGQGALEAVRNLALSLRPPMLDDLGLEPALEWQAREASRRYGLAVRVETNGELDRLSEESRTSVYRIAQEALHNACRHAAARNVRIVVRAPGSRVELRIEDDGQGFDARRRRGLGLLGMEERARRLGGVFNVESHPDRGTSISASWPLGGTA